MCDVSPTRWRLLPFGINVLLVSSAQRVGRVSHKTQGFHFINCRVYRVKERVSHKTQGFRFINCRVYRVVERVSHKTQGFHFINLLRGGAGRISGEIFFLMNFELLTFLCR